MQHTVVGRRGDGIALVALGYDTAGLLKETQMT